MLSLTFWQFFIALFCSLYPPREIDSVKVLQNHSLFGNTKRWGEIQLQTKKTEYDLRGVKRDRGREKEKEMMGEKRFQSKTLEHKKCFKLKKKEEMEREKMEKSEKKKHHINKHEHLTSKTRTSMPKMQWQFNGMQRRTRIKLWLASVLDPKTEKRERENIRKKTEKKTLISVYAAFFRSLFWLKTRL